ncbi:hypothetical protein KY290_002553 [Solanum tuberosum]|uniref:Uncharacterized protein n=1 Tax=Solanum tuberosum TaxID=4113 RepID=A0ABQ7WSL0_SOLTU|nr:hypothetical protein KY289_004873 [Solanum tuberosum]KAH0782955.1 hypothetical protein KY290_002553 [Solanum tuberosum]
MQLFHFTIARRSSLPRVSLHERQQEIIKTVHDEPLMPEAIWSELPWMSSHQCDQSSTPSTGDSVFSDLLTRPDISLVRPSVKMKLVNI